MSVRRNILAGWMSHLVTLVVGLFLVRYVKDTLGDTGYGAWIFVNSVAGYSGLLYMGFGAVICRWSAKTYAVQDWTALNRVVSSIFSIYAANSLIALAGAGVLAGFAQHLSDWEGQSLTDVRIVILLLGLNAAIGLWGSVFAGLLIGIQRYDLKRYVQIGVTIVRLVLVVVCLNWWPGLLAMALIFLAITIGENLAYYVMTRRLVPSLEVSRKHVTKETFRECFSFTAFNALGMVSDYIIYLTDTVLIGFFLGTAATVPYYIALRLCQMVRMPLENIAEVVLPKAGELHALDKREQLQSLVLKSTGLSLLLMGGFAIGTVYFGDRLISAWLGAGNEASSPILYILIAAQVISVPLLVPRKALMGMGMVRVTSLIDALEAGFNLILSLILVQTWGILGVAWGTLIPAAFCELVLLLPYVCRQLDIGWRSLLRDMIAPQVLPFAMLLGYCEAVSRMDLPPSWWSLILIAAGGGAVLIATRGVLHLIETGTGIPLLRRFSIAADKGAAS